MVFIKAARYKNGYEKLETDEENLQMRLCEGAHSNLGAITPIIGVLWALLDNIYWIVFCQSRWLFLALVIPEEVSYDQCPDGGLD